MAFDIEEIFPKLVQITYLDCECDLCTKYKKIDSSMLSWMVHEEAEKVIRGFKLDWYDPVIQQQFVTDVLNILNEFLEKNNE